MKNQGWMNRNQDTPPVSWDGKTKTFSIILSGLTGIKDGSMVEAEWSPPITYVVRIKEAFSDEWSFGFETPLTGCGFIGLKPDTEYEIEVRAKNAHGQSEPTLVKVRTGSDGSLGI